MPRRSGFPLPDQDYPEWVWTAKAIRTRSAAFVDCIFSMIFVRWDSTVLWPMNSSRAIILFDLPATNKSRTWPSRLVSEASRA